MAKTELYKILVSIVIPIRKGENIDRCINAIKKSTYQNYEIIIVDEGFERSKQRNIGTDRAIGEYLLILDSDMLITPMLIEECVNLIKSYDSIYIPEKIITPGLFAKIRNWERQFYTGTAVDVVRFVKAKDLPLCFDESMSGPEDSDWDRRIKGTRVISKNCFHHYDNVSFIKYFKKKAYYAKSMKIFEEKNPNDKILNFKWRCWTVFTENGKWKRLLKKPHLALAVMFIIFIRGIIYYTMKR